MIDWLALLGDALWVTGLAVILAAASAAGYEVAAGRLRLKEAAGRRGFLTPLCLGGALVCLGLVLGASSWWQGALLGALCTLLAVAARVLWARGGRKGRRAGAMARRVGPPAARRARRLGWFLILAGCLTLGAWIGVTGAVVLRHGRSLMAHARSLESLAEGGAQAQSTGTVRQAGEHLAGMRYDLEEIQDRAGPLLPLGRILRYVPRHGGDLVAASDLLRVAVGVVSAADRTYVALAPVLESPGAPGLSAGERAVTAVSAARPQLEAARTELGWAIRARSRIDADRLSPRVSDLVLRLDLVLPWLAAGLDGLLLAPEALGAYGPRTYLVLAQNNQELRPTGGFISGVGQLTVDGGRVTSLAFSDSYAVDNLEVPHDLAPPDMRAMLGGDLWFFRDSNWHADFPTSARKAMEIYGRDRGVAANGVVALDLEALVSLVDALGPLVVEGVEEPVTGENVVRAIQASWQVPPDAGILHGTEWWLHRKDSFGAIAAAAMDKLLAGRDLQPLRIARAIRRLLEEKHLMVYVDEPGDAGLLRRLGWDGAMPDPAGAGDFLMVADTNVGFNKADPNVERSITYRVELSGEQPEARLTLHYVNRSQRPSPTCVQESWYGETYADMMDRCYWDYVRAFVPAGSRLLAGPDLDLPPGSLLAKQPRGASSPALEGRATEGGWTAWTAFFDLSPGEQRTVAFEYQLPASVLARSANRLIFRLRVAKQPGTVAVPFCLELVPPAGWVLTRQVRGDDPSSAPGCTDLRTDREYTVVYEQGGNP